MTRFTRRSVAATGLAGAFAPALLRDAPVAPAAPSTPEAMPSVRIEVRPDKIHQTMDGFGASGAWWAQEIGGWDQGNRQRVIDLLFDRQRGIGLSLYRYNVGAGGGAEISDPWQRAETFEIAPGGYDWSRDRNAVWVLKAAHAAGVERFVAFANSPPARMTVSGLASGARDGGSNLLPAMYPAFARYLVDVTRHLREVEGVPIGWISPINEPQWAWSPAKGQEGCHYSMDECAAMVRTLIAATGTLLPAVKVSAPECGEWETAALYLDRLLGDPVAGPALDRFAIHSYASNATFKRLVAGLAARRFPRARLWMSEWTEMQSGRDTGMDSALTLANTVHEDITDGGVTSWQYWIAVSKYDFHDGLIYTDEGTQHIIETKRLWAMGNFSRFVRPGAVRIDASASADQLRVAAFRKSQDGSIVLVVINTAPQPVAASLAVVGNRFPLTLTAFETSAAHDLAQIASGPAPPRMTVAASSVTTILLR